MMITNVIIMANIFINIHKIEFNVYKIVKIF